MLYMLQKMSQKMSQKKQKDATKDTEDTKDTKDSTNMNKHNANIIKVWSEQGVDEAVKQMFVHPEKGTRMSYSEMRSFYG
jgi:hypothetical protein